jgi:hypothetical protein
LIEYTASQQQLKQQQGGVGVQYEDAVDHHHTIDQNVPRRVAKDSDNEDSGSDDEFDYLLDEKLPGEIDTIRELEEKRRAELEYEFFMRQVAGQHGYGVHRQLHPTRVLKAAGLLDTGSSGRIPPPAVVLHLVDPDSMGSASLDYFLETTLAPTNPGTVFLRSGGRSTLLMDPSVANKYLPSNVLDPDRDMPALLAIKDGIVVNACPSLHGLTNRNYDHIDTYAVRQWLENAGVLLKQAPRLDFLCAIRPEEDALMDYMGNAHKQETISTEEVRYNCGIEGCNKTFHHEHVGIQTSEQDGLVVKEDFIIGRNSE